MRYYNGFKGYLFRLKYKYEQEIYRQKLKEIILKYRKNPTLAAEQLLGVKLHWYQKFILNNISYMNHFNSRSRWKCYNKNYLDYLEKEIIKYLS